MAEIKESTLYYETIEKLDELLAANNLVQVFGEDEYPIVLTVSQDRDPAAQMELFSQDGPGISSRDARLSFIFQDGDIVVRTDSRLVISDALMSKIKKYAKKMHYLYLQAYYRERHEDTTDSQE